MELVHRPRSITHEIVHAVAEAEGVSHDELAEPLYAAIDPDALESLFKNNPACVTFGYLDYTVSVDNEGNVDVTESRYRA